MKLKAYQADHWDEGACVVFAVSNAAARTKAAAELGTDWHGLESCRRAPEFDAYAPGPVPPLVLIKHGWWMECLHCGRKVHEHMDDDLLDEGLDPNDFEPQPAGRKSIYCSAACAAQDAAHERANSCARNALCDLIYTRFPDATITLVHVYGDRLHPPKREGGYLVDGIPCLVIFNLPGLTNQITYHFGEPYFYVSKVDEARFRDLYGERS